MSLSNFSWNPKSRRGNERLALPNSFVEKTMLFGFSGSQSQWRPVFLRVPFAGWQCHHNHRWQPALVTLCTSRNCWISRRCRHPVRPVHSYPSIPDGWASIGHANNEGEKQEYQALRGNSPIRDNISVEQRIQAVSIGFFLLAALTHWRKLSVRPLKQHLFNHSPLPWQFLTLYTGEICRKTSHPKNSTNSGPSKSAPGKHPVFPSGVLPWKWPHRSFLLEGKLEDTCKPAADMPGQNGFVKVQALQPCIMDQALTLTPGPGAVSIDWTKPILVGAFIGGWGMTHPFSSQSDYGTILTMGSGWFSGHSAVSRRWSNRSWGHNPFWWCFVPSPTGSATKSCLFWENNGFVLYYKALARKIPLVTSRNEDVIPSLGNRSIGCWIATISRFFRP